MARQGKAVLQQLRDCGIPAANVTRVRGTSHYYADFWDYRHGTSSARVWADRIKSAFDGCVVLSTHQIIAPWKQGCPVISATIRLVIENGLRPRPQRVMRLGTGHARKGLPPAPPVIYADPPAIAGLLPARVA